MSGKMSVGVAPPPAPENHDKDRQHDEGIGPPQRQTNNRDHIYFSELPPPATPVALAVSTSETGGISCAVQPPPSALISQIDASSRFVEMMRACCFACKAAACAVTTSR